MSSKPTVQGSVSLLNGVCTTDLFSAQPRAYETWRNRYGAFHPEFASIYDVGSLCVLQDGTTLVSFSYFHSPDPKSRQQSVVLFDTNNNPLKETTGIHCRFIGDFPAPRIQAVTDGVAEILCVSADAGLSLAQRYLFDLSSFAVMGQLESTVHYDLTQ
jgi:hypothetical protein